MNLFLENGWRGKWYFVFKDCFASYFEIQSCCKVKWSIGYFELKSVIKPPAEIQVQENVKKRSVGRRAMLKKDYSTLLDKKY